MPDHSSPNPNPGVYGSVKINNSTRATTNANATANTIPMTARIAGLRERILATVPEIFADRAEIVTRSYLASMGQPALLRRARAFKDILEGIPIGIAPGELIVGGSTGQPRGCQVFPEFDMGFVLNELDSFEQRSADRFAISTDTKQRLKAIYPHWQGNSIADNALGLFGDDQRACLSDLVFILTALRSGVGHVIVDYPLVLTIGLQGIKQRIADQEAGLDINAADYTDRLVYYHAARLCCDALISFARRHAVLAEEQAASATDPMRRAELASIAAVCRRMPEQPATSFHEALQSFWFVHLALHLEANGHSMSPGRFDQYMLPYYDSDRRRGIADEALTEQLHALWLKFFEINKVRDKVSSLAFGGYPMFQNLILGGQDAHGRSAVNDLSHLCLDATAVLRLPQPSLSVRWFHGCPESFLDHAFDVVALGTGMPALFNDEVLIPNMLQMGYSLADARNYGIVGCTETTGHGNVEPWLTGGFINALKILELTIFDGTDPFTGRGHPLRTGDPAGMASFDDFMAAYRRQVAYYLGQLVAADNILDSLHGRICPTPFESLVIDGCLKNGRTSLEGGAKYNATTFELVGLPNVADSLHAIRTMVYEQATLTWPELQAALRTGFRDQPALQMLLRGKLSKYGNDNAAVDSLGSDLVDWLFDEVQQYRSPRGGPYRLALYSIASHALFATKTGATPDGRGIGEVLADGGVSCSQGRDKEGLTALFNSVTRLDPMKALGSCLLNVRLSPALFRGENRRKLTDTVKTFFRDKGQHVQFNVFDTATLREAQQHPEHYPNLMVRVAGFSVLFTTIDRQLQDDIIARTEQQSGGQPNGGELAGGQPRGGQPAIGQPGGGQPSGGQPTGGQPSSGQPSGGQPAGGQA
jgi:formate C-acetyltransferase